VSGSPLLIGPAQREALDELREKAAATPVEMKGLIDRLESPIGKAAHMARMTEQSLELPFGFLVTFSIETGHPCGVARHLSMSSPKVGRVPTPDGLWMIAEILGFTGSLDDCIVWPEKLQGHAGMAINVIQPIENSGHTEGRA
jgi:hypothetical protein